MSEPSCVGPGIGGPLTCKKCGEPYRPSAEVHSCPSGPEAQRMLPELKRSVEVLRFAAASARKQVAALTEENAKLRRVLKLVEWEGGTVLDIGGDMSASCPLCGFAQTTGHANTCEVGAALSSGSELGEQKK